MKFENLIGDLFPLEVALTHSAKAALKKGFDVSNDYAATLHVADRKFLVYINPATDRPWQQDAGLLTHEAVHVMQGYFDAIGEKRPGCEMQAYIVQAVSQFLWQEHFEWKKKAVE